MFFRVLGIQRKKQAINIYKIHSVYSKNSSPLSISAVVKYVQANPTATKNLLNFSGSCVATWYSQITCLSIGMFNIVSVNSEIAPYKLIV